MDGLPPVTNGDTPWTPDAAHQPSLAYVPYLITGDRFYLDELLFWANWDMGGIDSGYRDGAKGLINMNQIRGQAWSLRTLGEAAMALPDAHPMKSYFSQRLHNNLQWYVDRYPRNRDPERVSPLGWIERPEVPGSTPPWQDDFLALVTGHLAEAGFPLAEEFFRWQAQSTVGRWTMMQKGIAGPPRPATTSPFAPRPAPPSALGAVCFARTGPIFVHVRRVSPKRATRTARPALSLSPKRCLPYPAISIFPAPPRPSIDCARKRLRFSGRRRRTRVGRLHLENKLLKRWVNDDRCIGDSYQLRLADFRSAAGHKTRRESSVVRVRSGAAGRNEEGQAASGYPCRITCTDQEPLMLSAFSRDNRPPPESVQGHL